MDGSSEDREATLVFERFNVEGRFSEGTTLLEAARALGVSVAAVCGGRGICGKCRVIVRDGQEFLSEPSPAERRLLTSEEIKAGIRLACQASVVGCGRVVVDVPFLGGERLLTGGVRVALEPEPAVTEISVEVAPPTLEDPIADLERLLRDAGLPGDERIEKNVLERLPNVLRESGWKVTMLRHARRGIIAIKPSERRGRLLGFAVDVGTTKLAGYLVDLRTGEILAASAALNPQVAYGDDVISRIAYVSRSQGRLGELRDAVVRGICSLIEDACRRAGADPDEIVELVAVGNTLMHHLLLGLPPDYLALSPYTPVVRRSLDLSASEVGLRMLPSGNVHVLPNVAGFVGADAVADVLVTGIHRSKELSLLIDLGTNTEIILGNREVLYAASCASGPAFEGGHIRFGVRAESGAIERVWIDPETLEVGYQTVGGERPTGICGSGVIDAVAEMLRTGIVDTSGRFVEGVSPRVREGPEGLEFVLAWRDETSIGADIVITQQDVREIQKAKAAVYAGIAILMSEMRVSLDDIRRIYVAGAFGLYVDPVSARAIGMFPSFPLHLVTQVGNAAGMGAVAALTSLSKREECAEIVELMRYVELAAHPRFQKEFAAAMYLPHLDLDAFREVLAKMNRIVISKSHAKLYERHRGKKA